MSDARDELTRELKALKETYGQDDFEAVVEEFAADTLARRASLDSKGGDLDGVLMAFVEKIAQKAMSIAIRRSMKSGL